MGHRANFVVIESGIASAYFDNWAALGCVYYVVEGPEKAVLELKDMERTNELLDWAFCEGGFLIDYDSRLLIVFGEFLDPADFDDDNETEEDEDEDEGSGPSFDLQKEEADVREFLSKLRSAWQGWTLRWDQRGADAFAEHLRARGLTNPQASAPSHPDDCLQVEIPGAA